MRALLLFFIFISQLSRAQSFSSYVNPLIGTGGHGHTFPGPVMPFGMVQLSPDTRVDGSWDGCGGYHYSDSIIYGFSHTHLSGTGVSDWGDILVMPVTSITTDPKIYSSRFKHTNEKAEAGFYEVLLSDENINAELTVTERTGIHRYTFPPETENHIVLDLLHRDKVLACNLKIVDSVTVSGYRISEGWAKKQQVYFVMRFSKSLTKTTFSKAGLDSTYRDSSNKTAAVFSFRNDGNPLIVKVGISSTGIDGAAKNLHAEATHWNFGKYKNDAARAWDKQLNRIEVADTIKKNFPVFYTALYHCFIHPSLNMDVDGQFLGRDGKVHTAEGFVNYSVFSLWDTYRAVHPLFTVLQPTRNIDFLKSFLQQYKDVGRLPMWELSSNETDCMIAFHSVSVLADAMMKSETGLDVEVAYEAMKAASNYSAYSIPIFNEKGFLQSDDESESVSKSLEYAYDSWCISQIATRLGKTEEANLFLKRSQSYKHLFDPVTGFMRPRKNGDWLKPFSAAEINNHFTEGNSWQYSFYVPHDVSGLMNLHGGVEKFEHKLDKLFNTSEKNSGRDQADVTGLVGQYAHGNEPSHHMAYLYNFVGKPEKTIKRVEQLRNNFYNDDPAGLIGNEDCGQMSAWYVFSALGMYPVCPGTTQYVLGSPLFSDIKIQHENGNTFQILKEGTGHELQHVVVNTQKSFKSYISHSTVNSTGSLKFISGRNKNYGLNENMPVTVVRNVTVIPAPLIQSKTQVFKKETKIQISAVDKIKYDVRYTTDGSPPMRNSQKYTGPLTVDSITRVKARLFLPKDSSIETSANFYRIKYDHKIHLKNDPDKQYAAEGSQSLVDGIPSDKDWRKGNWLGFQGKDFECVVDLHHTKISSVGLNCLQDTRSWILFPMSVSFYESVNGKDFTLIETIVNKVSPQDYEITMQKFAVQLKENTSVKYLKIIAHNYGRLPQWHMGAGGQAYIFTDELELR